MGVEGNHPKISFGGHLLRALLDSGDYVCLINSSKCTGGPFTRYEPSSPKDKDKMSCLDFVIISKRLYPYVDTVLIDSQKEFSPLRPISKVKSVTSDHFPIIVTFTNLPMKNTKKKTKVDNFTIWNTNKENGWNNYEYLTRKDELFKNICIAENTDMNRNDVSPTDAMDKINNVMTKVKHTAFGKVKISKNTKKKTTDESIESLLTQQRVDIESEFEKISELKKTRGKTAAIFKTFDKIKGKSKDGPELVAMKDPETDDFIFSPDKLKEVSLKYCANLLDNQKVDKDFADEIECENLVHYSRMKEDTDDVEEMSRDEFEKRLKLLATKSKEKYKFLLKSGESFKNCIFRLFSQVWNQETKPQQWRNTVIIQLYKGKGEICNFDSQRNIYIPKRIFQNCLRDLLLTNLSTS